MSYDVANGDMPPGGTVKCGNRVDLPKAQRRHDYVSLGPEIRNCEVLGFQEGIVYACATCGADKFTRRKHDH
jgi:hypothetical protein